MGYGVPLAFGNEIMILSKSKWNIIVTNKFYGMFVVYLLLTDIKYKLGRKTLKLS